MEKQRCCYWYWTSLPKTGAPLSDPACPQAVVLGSESSDHNFVLNALRLYFSTARLSLFFLVPLNIEDLSSDVPCYPEYCQIAVGLPIISSG